ncbi:MAG: hypothetical protein ACK4VY_02620 [Brevundimonas sp.]
MKRFSITAAAAEPFRLAGGRPLSVLVWGLVLLAPSLVVLGAMIPFIGEMAASGAFDPESLAADADAGPFAGDMATAMEFHLWSNLAQLLGFLTLVLATTAIARAVYAGPRGDRALFLRLGMTEFQVAVVGLAVGIGFFIVAMLVSLLAVGIGFAVWQLGDPLRWPLCVALGIAAFIGLVLLWGRLSLLAPACVRYRSFAFEEGWRLGRGQTRRLFGLWLFLILIGIVFWLGFLIVLGIILLTLAGGVELSDPDAIEAAFETLAMRPAMLAAIAAVLVIPLAWLQGLWQTLFTAPFAHVVQALASEAPAAVAEEFH